MLEQKKYLSKRQRMQPNCGEEVVNKSKEAKMI